MKLATLLLTLLLVPRFAVAQVTAPKNESRFHHLFAAHRDRDNLPQRYNDLRCALVLIQAGPRLGTGFYINPSGDIVTASHVLGDRLFNQLPDGRMQIILQGTPFVFIMKDVSGQYTTPLAQVDPNADNWAYDLAILHTNRPTSCWLRIGNDKLAKPGEHLVTLGFPGLAFGSLTMYTGILRCTRGF